MNSTRRKEPWGTGLVVRSSIKGIQGKTRTESQEDMAAVVTFGPTTEPEAWSVLVFKGGGAHQATHTHFS